MGFDPGRLVGDEGIGGGVRLVEAVACKGLDLLKDCQRLGPGDLRLSGAASDKESRVAGPFRP